jgi:thiopurine S-methyltransferase
MDHNFWHQRWESNDIAFHRSEPNPLLIKYISELSLKNGSRVFVPLCGKTLDIGWLLSHGYRVAGVELSEMAVKELFAELGTEPQIVKNGKLKHYSAKDIVIFVGDIFDLSGEMLGPVDAVYDRAALVALPEQMRKRYSSHLMKITDEAPQLLICYEYDQLLMEGPPFSVSEAEVGQHYAKSYDITRVESMNMPDGPRGLENVKKSVWLLRHDQ